MKLSNLFKKAIKNTATVQKLEKTHLSKVVGGAGKGINESGIKYSEKGINQAGIK